MNLCLCLLLSLLSLLLGSEEIELLFAGDAMQHKSQLEAAKNAGGGTEYDYTSYFKEIEPFIKSADYAVVNLECPLGGKGFSGYPAFCAPDEYAISLKDAGFDLALTANNHILDRGGKGLQRTLWALDSIGMSHVGTYRHPEERDSASIFITDVNGFHLGFLNYTYGTNGIPCPPSVHVDYIDKSRMKEDIRRLRQSGAEIITVCPHWGLEYKLLPERQEKQLADSLIAWGADIVMGGHPHVIQPMELRGDSTAKKLVVYSLGNFISGMRTDDTRGGALCRVIIKRDKMGKPYVADASYRLVYTESPTNPSRENYRLIPAEKDIADPMTAASKRRFVENAERVFSTHNVNVNRDITDSERALHDKLKKTAYQKLTDDE